MPVNGGQYSRGRGNFKCFDRKYKTLECPDCVLSFFDRNCFLGLKRLFFNFFCRKQLFFFLGDEVFVGLSAADDGEVVAIDKNLRQKRTGIVIAAHGISIGSGGEDRD